MRVYELEEFTEEAILLPAAPLHSAEYAALVTHAESYIFATRHDYLSPEKERFQEAVRGARRRIEEGA